MLLKRQHLFFSNIIYHLSIISMLERYFKERNKNSCGIFQLSDKIPFELLNSNGDIINIDSLWLKEHYNSILM